MDPDWDFWLDQVSIEYGSETLFKTDHFFKTYKKMMALEDIFSQWSL